MNKNEITAVNAVITLSNMGYLTENEQAVIMNRIMGVSSSKKKTTKAQPKAEKTAKTAKWKDVVFPMTQDGNIVQLLPNGGSVDKWIFWAAKKAAQAVGATYFKRRSAEYRLTFKSDADAGKFVAAWSNVSADRSAEAYDQYQQRKAQ